MWSAPAAASPVRRAARRAHGGISSPTPIWLPAPRCLGQRMSIRKAGLGRGELPLPSEHGPSLERREGHRRDGVQLPAQSFLLGKQPLDRGGAPLPEHKPMNRADQSPQLDRGVTPALDPLQKLVQLGIRHRAVPVDGPRVVLVGALRARDLHRLGIEWSPTGGVDRPRHRHPWALDELQPRPGKAVLVSQRLQRASDQRLQGIWDRGWRSAGARRPCTREPRSPRAWHAASSIRSRAASSESRASSPMAALACASGDLTGEARAGGQIACRASAPAPFEADRPPRPGRGWHAPDRRPTSA